MGMYMFAHWVLLSITIATSQPAVQTKTTETDPVIKDFNERVDRYWDLHKKIESDAPPIDKKKEPDPAAIVQREMALAEGIRAARRNAAEGEVFTPTVQRVFLAALRQALSTGRGAKAREMILGEGNPKGPEAEARVPLVVNAKYPSSAPLSTVPPSVLLRLPQLPKGLEYRFVGRHLILLDSSANLIVDILRNAIH
jgi:hypothetical protein